LLRSGSDKQVCVETNVMKGVRSEVKFEARRARNARAGAIGGTLSVARSALTPCHATTMAGPGKMSMPATHTPFVAPEPHRMSHQECLMLWRGADRQATDEWYGSTSQPHIL